MSIETEDATEEVDDVQEKTESPEIDYKVIADQQAMAIKELRRKMRDNESKQHSAESESGESKSEDISSVVESVLEARERRESLRVIEDALDDLTEDEAERSAILSVYENRLKPSGFSPKSIVSDLRTAQMIVNPGVIAKKVEADVRKTEATKAAMANGKAGQMATKGDEGGDAKPKMSRAEKALARGLGIKVD